MSFKHKFSYEDKLMIVEKYIIRKIGFREACRVYGMAQGALKDWKRLYETLVKAITDFMNYYTNERPQRGLGVLTPMEFHKKQLRAA